MSLDIGTKDGDSSAEDSPVAPQFDEETMANFPNGRLEPPETVICKHCKKVVLKRTAKDHVSGCLKSKQEKARKKKEAREKAQREKERAEKGDEDDDDDDDIRDGKSKKRKADDDGKDNDGPKKKKNKKEEPKPKQAKTKGPVDVERQCGVVLPNASQCARSLTCKSHSMGAKRAVPGRSLPYDMLLAAYQKKNQARQQSELKRMLAYLILIHLVEAAIDANAPAPDEDLEMALAGPVDSDEERDQVMTAISRSLSRPSPLVSAPLIPTRRKYQLVRMKEMLSNALSGNRNGNLFAVPQEARSAYPTSGINDNYAMPSAVAPSPAPIGVGMAQPGMKSTSARKASVDAG